MRHLKVSLLLVERKRCAGEFLLISVSSSNALSLLQSPGAGDDIRFMDDASSNPGKISSCVSAVVYRVSLCAVFISTWLTVIVLLTQATSLDKCSSNFGRRSVCVCLCVRICIVFAACLFHGPKRIIYRRFRWAVGFSVLSFFNLFLEHQGYLIKSSTNFSK